ncbi:ribonuclease H-like domain-containing protein [Macrophomina phaseolina]|uniref:ribonuclease H n=1 Tax=Macrophomina phaseolina TaxID=35725 RepID=A0ABQ8GRX7_9PEZI|nr:ribonuclease H-like domain-containing protein [Macrophomina phaseolina]
MKARLHVGDTSLSQSTGDDVPRGVDTILGSSFHELVRHRFGSSLGAVTRAAHAAGEGAQGVWTASVFAPPSNLTTANPQELFVIERNVPPTTISSPRFTLQRQYIPVFGNIKTMAIFIDGACSNNGAPASRGRTARGGWAFVFRSAGEGGVVSGALELEGPDGTEHQHTSNRAELRAAIAALQFRAWDNEGWGRVVLITDSMYVGVNATGQMRRWAERGWMTASGMPVKNQDLWKALSDCIRELARCGCEVSFWTVPRRWNAEADAAAKAAVDGSEQQEYTIVYGVQV